MQVSWRVYVVSALVASVVAAVTAFVTVRVVGPPAPQAPANGLVALEGALNGTSGKARHDCNAPGRERTDGVNFREPRPAADSHPAAREPES
jgi:hypothetical protein